jgi:hypothetical protein
MSRVDALLELHESNSTENGALVSASRKKHERQRPEKQTTFSEQHSHDIRVHAPFGGSALP